VTRRGKNWAGCPKIIRGGNKKIAKRVEGGETHGRGVENLDCEKEYAKS